MMEARIPAWIKTGYAAVTEARCPNCNGKVHEIENGYKCESCKWSVQIKDPKVGKLTRFWLKLNNNKSIIGGGLVAVGFLSSLFLQPLGEGLKWIGYTVLGSGAVTSIVGVGHKAVKLVGKAKAKNEKGEQEWWVQLIVQIINVLIKYLKKGG